MGNRAVIAIGKREKTKSKRDKQMGIYLHWNGGRPSIAAFIKAADDLGIRCQCDPSYAAARLCQLVGNWFGGILSLGVGHLSDLDCVGNNGTYYIENWKIVGREHYDMAEEEIDTEQTKAIYSDLMEINKPIFEKDIS